MQQPTQDLATLTMDAMVQAKRSLLRYRGNDRDALNELAAHADKQASELDLSSERHDKHVLDLLTLSNTLLYNQTQEENRKKPWLKVGTNRRRSGSTSGHRRRAQIHQRCQDARIDPSRDHHCTTTSSGSAHPGTMSKMPARSATPKACFAPETRHEQTSRRT